MSIISVNLNNTSSLHLALGEKVLSSDLKTGYRGFENISFCAH